MFPKIYYVLLNSILNLPEGKNERLFRYFSPYQKIELFKNGGDYWLALNDEMQFHTKEADLSHYYMVTLPAKAVRNPKSILIIGGGDGLPAKQALKHSFQNIKNVELDGVLAGLVKKHPLLQMISNNSFNSKRVDLKIGDGIDYVINSKRKWDIIVDDCEIEITKQPPGFKEKYETYQECLISKLNPGGIACMMQPFDTEEDDFFTEPQRLHIRKILFSKNPTRNEINYIHNIMATIYQKAVRHMKDELNSWLDIGAPFINYRIPILPEIGAEMHIYLSNMPIKLPQAKKCREIKL